MNNLKITLTASSLTGLTPGVGGAYNFIVDFLKSDGTPLNSPNAPNSTNLSVTPSGSTFVLNIPITSGDYTILGITIKIYNQSRQNCCVTSTNYNLYNTSSDAPAPTVGVRDGKRTVEANGAYYDIVNSEFAFFQVLPNGNVRLDMPTSQSSFNGQRTVSPIVLDSFWADMKDNNPDQLAALRSSGGIAMHDFTQLTVYGYPARTDWGTTLREIKEGNPIHVWWSFGNNDASNGVDKTYSNNSGQLHRASIYKYKLSY